MIVPTILLFTRITNDATDKSHASENKTVSSLELHHATQGIQLEMQNLRTIPRPQAKEQPKGEEEIRLDQVTYLNLHKET